MIQPPVKDIAEHILSEAAGKDRLLVAIAGPPQGNRMIYFAVIISNRKSSSQAAA